MKNITSVLKNTAIILGILILCFIACLILQETLREDLALIPAIFVLGVFLSSVVTPGYIYGIASALLSVLAVNFAFTFPYFALDFTIPENIISAIILLIVTIVTCGLTAKIKYHEMIKAEGEKERMRANLLRAVSHDLRTPLTTIYGSSSALFDNLENFSTAEQKRMLKGICDDSLWLTRMVENLLSVTRLDGDNVEIIKSDTDLYELIDSALIKFKKRYPSVKVDVDIPDEFILIPMDALLIEQVIINLLENAAEHAKGMTGIKLKVFIISNKAVFEISDDGCGIPNDKIKDIFSGYIGSDSAPSDGKKRNSGIGLSVCASIIKAHGGDIKAENLKTHGCVFRICLNMEDKRNE